MKKNKKYTELYCELFYGMTPDELIGVLENEMNQGKDGWEYEPSVLKKVVADSVAIIE